MPNLKGVNATVLFLIASAYIHKEVYDVTEDVKRFKKDGTLPDYVEQYLALQ